MVLEEFLNGKSFSPPFSLYIFYLALPCSTRRNSLSELMFFSFSQDHSCSSEIPKLSLSVVVKVEKYEANLIMCITVTHICSAATINECFLVLQSIKYLRQQMFSILDNVLKVKALATLFKKDSR